MCRKLQDYVRFAACHIAQPVTGGYPHVAVETELWNRERKRTSQTAIAQYRNEGRSKEVYTYTHIHTHTKTSLVQAGVTNCLRGGDDVL